MEHKQALYDLSYDTGATLSDHKIDVDGGIGTIEGPGAFFLFVRPLRSRRP